MSEKLLYKTPQGKAIMLLFPVFEEIYQKHPAFKGQGYGLNKIQNKLMISTLLKHKQDIINLVDSDEIINKGMEKWINQLLNLQII